MNKSDLLKTLDLSRSNDIFDVLGRMEVVAQVLQEEPRLKSINAFFRTYMFVTKEVASDNLRQKHNFDNWRQTEQLDIEFAKLFFKPLEGYLNSQDAPKPWQEFFAYCEDPNSIAFCRLLLGINAHINGDLAHALFKTNLKSYRDFMHVNDLLLNVLPQVMLSLASIEHDLLAVGGSVARNIARAEFTTIVIRWRNQAWEDYLKLKNDTIDLDEIHNKAELKAQKIVELFNKHHLVIDAPALIWGLNRLG